MVAELPYTLVGFVMVGKKLQLFKEFKNSLLYLHESYFRRSILKSPIMQTVLRNLLKLYNLNILGILTVHYVVGNELHKQYFVYGQLKLHNNWLIINIWGFFKNRILKIF